MIVTRGSKPSQVRRLPHATVPGLTNPPAAGSRSIATRPPAAAWSWLAPVVVSDLVMRVRVGAQQLQVPRLLYTHRLLTTAQVHALAFETASRRICEICLQRVHQRGWVVRAEPLHGGAGGGRRGYVYGLSEAGAEVLTAP